MTSVQVFTQVMAEGLVKSSQAQENSKENMYFHIRAKRLRKQHTTMQGTSLEPPNLHPPNCKSTMMTTALPRQQSKSKK